MRKIRYRFYLILKRFFDIVFSMLALIFLIPISIILKIVTMCTGDFNSIFYIQTRVGLNGKSFKLFKYRSMIPNADEVLKEMLTDPKYKKEWDKNQKFKNDPRITSIGKFLRKTSLDETPQFFNVLMNKMSIVGPRPLILGELDKHNGNHEIYESVKPGITGYWASNKLGKISYKKRLQMEYFYIKNRSLKLDLKCIFMTFRVIFNNKSDKK